MAIRHYCDICETEGNVSFLRMEEVKGRAESTQEEHILADKNYEICDSCRQLLVRTMDILKHTAFGVELLRLIQAHERLKF